jgi:hypothetical protein
LIRKRDLILLFLPVYDSSVRTPDLGDQAEALGSGFDDLALDFDWLQGLQPQDELAGSQLGGAPPTWTREGEGTQSGGSQLPGATGEAQP